MGKQRKLTRKERDAKRLEILGQKITPETLPDGIVAPSRQDILNTPPEHLGMRPGDISRTFPSIMDVNLEEAPPPVPEGMDPIGNLKEALGITDQIVPYEKIKTIRKVTRDNKQIPGWTPEMGDESSVLMASADNLAFPTLFPVDPENPTSDPKDWIEYPQDQWREALNEAKRRDEVFEFDTPEEADNFARGSWKTAEPKDLPSLSSPETKPDTGPFTDETGLVLKTSKDPDFFPTLKKRKEEGLGLYEKEGKLYSLPTPEEGFKEVDIEKYEAYEDELLRESETTGFIEGEVPAERTPEQQEEDQYQVDLLHAKTRGLAPPRTKEQKEGDQKAIDAIYQQVKREGGFKEATKETPPRTTNEPSDPFKDPFGEETVAVDDFPPPPKAITQEEMDANIATSKARKAFIGQVKDFKERVDKEIKKAKPKGINRPEEGVFVDKPEGYTELQQVIRALDDIIEGSQSAGGLGIVDFWRGTKHNPEELLPFVGVLPDILSSSNIQKIYNKPESERTDAENQLLRATAMLNHFEASGYKSGAYEMGEIFGMMIPYAIEFGMTGGIFSTGKSLGLKAGQAALKGAAQKGAGKFATQIASNLTGSLFQSTASVHRWVGEGYKRLSPQAQTILTENGLQIIGEIPGDGAFEAFGKAYLINASEFITEKWGQALGVGAKRLLTSKLGKLVLTEDYFKKVTLARIMELENIKTMGAAKTLMNKIGWHGAITEVWGEEYPNMVINAAIEGDKEGVERALNPANDDLLKMVIPALVFGGMMRGVNQITRRETGLDEPDESETTGTRKGAIEPNEIKPIEPEPEVPAKPKPKASEEVAVEETKEPEDTTEPKAPVIKEGSELKTKDGRVIKFVNGRWKFMNEKGKFNVDVIDKGQEEYSKLYLEGSTTEDIAEPKKVEKPIIESDKSQSEIEKNEVTRGLYEKLEAIEDDAAIKMIDEYDKSKKVISEDWVNNAEELLKSKEDAVQIDETAQVSLGEQAGVSEEVDSGGTETKTKPTEQKESKIKIVDVPIANIGQDLDRFQNRIEEFSEESSKNLIGRFQDGTFDITKFDPIKLWEENGKPLILAGHSRYNAFEWLNKNWNFLTGKAKANLQKQGIVKGVIPATMMSHLSEQEAKDFATKESNTMATAENDLDAAKLAKRTRDEGGSKAAIDRALKGRPNRKRAILYSYLNEKGKAYQAIATMIKAKQPDSRVSTIGEFIGAAREAYPALTDSHENELYDWMTEGTGSKITQRSDFVNRVGNVSNSPSGMLFEADKPLNIAKSRTLGENEGRIRSEIADLRKERAEAQKRYDQATTDGVMGEAKRMIKNLDAEILRLNQKIAEAKKSDKDQGDLFAEPKEDKKEDKKEPEKPIETPTSEEKAPPILSAQQVYDNLVEKHDAATNDAVRERLAKLIGVYERQVSDYVQSLDVGSVVKDTRGYEYKVYKVEKGIVLAKGIKSGIKMPVANTITGKLAENIVFGTNDIVKEATPDVIQTPVDINEPTSKEKEPTSEPSEPFILYAQKPVSKTGRPLTAIPKTKLFSKDRNAKKMIKDWDKWLIVNARKEAKASNYEQNFIDAINPDNILQADRDMLNDFLFGQTDVKISTERPPSLYEAGAGSGPSEGRSTSIDYYEEREGGIKPPIKGKFKIFNEFLKLAEKWAPDVQYGQGRVKAGSIGTYWPNIIRSLGLNDMDVNIHELTHAVDDRFNVIKKLIAGTTRGEPIRKRLTDIYEDMYPGAKRTHNLDKRMTEGMAVLIQFYTQHPTVIKGKYGDLVDDLLTKNGRFTFQGVEEFLKDIDTIVKQYQQLDELEKVSSSIADEPIVKPKKEYKSKVTEIEEEVADNLAFVEAMIVEKDLFMTKDDFAQMMRFYSPYMWAHNNVSGTHEEYHVFNDKGEFKKKYDFNMRTVDKNIKKRGLEKEWAAYLFAKKVNEDYDELAALYQERDELNEKLTTTREEKPISALEEAKKLNKIAAMQQHLAELMEQVADKEILIKDYGYKEVTTRSAENIGRPMFEDELDKATKMADERLELLYYSQIVDKKFYDRNKNRFYVPMRTVQYDASLGIGVDPLEDSPEITDLGPGRVSGTLKRTGSKGKPIINPWVAAQNQEVEIMQKATRQMIYNSMVPFKDQFPDLFLPTKYYPGIEKDPNVIIGRKNHKRVAMTPKEDMKYVIDNAFDVIKIGNEMAILLGASRMFRQGTTGAFPFFPITNIPLDQISAGVNSLNGYIPFITPIMVGGPAMAQAWIGRQAEYLNRRLGTTFAVPESKRSRLARDYMALAGYSQTFVRGQEESFKSNLDNKIDKIQGLSAVRGAYKVLEIPGLASEIVSRVSEYILSIEAGNPQFIAKEQAGRVTTPFHHTGVLKKGPISRQGVQAIPFFGAQIQVLHQQYRTLKTPGGRKRAAFTAMSMISLALYSTLKLLNDDERKEQLEVLKSTDPTTMARYLFLPNLHGKGNSLMKIRMPENYYGFVALSNMLLLQAYDQVQYRPAEYVGAATAWLPTQFNALEPIQMLFSWVPPVIKAPIETAFNVKSYPTIRPIVGYWEEKKADREEYNEWTSKVALVVGDKLNFSPKKIDHLITGMFGRTTKIFMMKPGIWDFDTYLKREMYINSSRQVLNYYNIKKEVGEKWTTLKDKKELKSDEAKKIKEMQNIIKGSIYKTKGTINDPIFFRRKDGIDDLWEEYGNIDGEKEPMRESNKRMEIFRKIAELEKIYYKK